MAAHGWMDRFGNDDGYLIGPAYALFHALEHFAAEVRVKCLLHLQVPNTEVFTWSGVLPAKAPVNVKRVGVQIGGDWHLGYLCYGITVGTQGYCQLMLIDKVQDVRGEVDRVKQVLEDSQAIWCILQCSLAQKVDWHPSLSHPSDVHVPAMEMETILWELLQHSTRLYIPKCEGHWRCFYLISQERMASAGGSHRQGRGSEKVGDFPGSWQPYSCRVSPGLGDHETRSQGMFQLPWERVSGRSCPYLQKSRW